MKSMMAVAGILAMGAAFAPLLAAEKPGLALPAPGIISAESGKKLLDSRKDMILIDVRTEEEFSSGHIEGAALLPYDEIDATKAATLIPTKASPVIIYCRSGRRSAIAAASLRGLGYAKVYDMGGINSWPYGTVK